VCANEVKGEAPDDGHVFGSVALPVSGEIVLEVDIEDPVRALDAPVAADRGGEFINVERGRGDVGSGLVCDFAGLLGCGMDLDSG
jgi:hypothetical protein